MEPFTILCDTCAARLKVSRVTLIGQVLACPKCGSMVKVVAPDDWNLDDETIPNIPVKKPEQKNKPRPKPDLTGPETVTNFEDVDNLIAREQSLPTTSLPQKRSQTKASQSGAASTAGATTADSGAMLPDQNWTSEGTKKKQRLTLILASSLAAVVLCTVLIIAMAVNWGKKDDSDSTAKKDDQGNAVAETNTNEVEEDETNKETENEIPQIGNQDVDSEDPDPEQVTNPDEVTQSPKNETPVELPGDTDTPMVESPLVENPENPNQEDENDPFDLNLDGDDPGTRTDPILGNSLNDTEEIATQLGELNRLLADAGVTLGEIKSVAESTRQRQLVGIPKYFIPKPDRPSSILKVALSNKFAGLMNDETSLIEFVREAAASPDIRWEFMSSQFLPVVLHWTGRFRH